MATWTDNDIEKWTFELRMAAARSINQDLRTATALAFVADQTERLHDMMRRRVNAAETMIAACEKLLEQNELQRMTMPPAEA